MEEQAEIARSLNIRENSVDAPEALTLNNLSISVNSDVPYYLRGFDAINKEIELMQNRSEPDAFVSAIQNLKAEERRILQDNTVERMLDALSLSPASQIDTFAAVDFNIGSTRFLYQQKFSLIIALSIVLGIFVGCIVVLIKSALSKRNDINAHNSL